MLCDGQTFASAFLPSFRANHTLLSPNKSHTSLILPCLYLSANCSLTFQLKPLPLWPVALNFVTTLRTSDLPQDLFLISTSFPFAVWKLSTIWPTWLSTALQFAVIHTNIHLFTCLQSACMINHCGSSPLPSLHFTSSFVHSILLQHFFFNWLAKHLTLAVRLGLHEIPPHPAYLLCVFFFLCQDKEFAPTCSRDCFVLRFSFVSNFPSCCTILAWEVAQLTPCSICDAMAQPVTSSNLRQTSTVPPEMPCLQNWNSHFGASRRLSGLATSFVRKLSSSGTHRSLLNPERKKWSTGSGRHPEKWVWAQRRFKKQISAAHERTP